MGEKLVRLSKKVSQFIERDAVKIDNETSDIIGETLDNIDSPFGPDTPHPVGTRRPTDVRGTYQLRPLVPVHFGRPEDVHMRPNLDVVLWDVLGTSNL